MQKIAGSLILCLMLGVGADVRAAPFDAHHVRSSGLTPDEAKQVLTLVLRHQKFALSRPGMWIDGPWSGEGAGTYFREGYYDFGLVYDNPRGLASNVLGHYAVSIATGDVWQTESCERYRFPALVKIQRQISAKTGQMLKDADQVRDELGC